MSEVRQTIEAVWRMEAPRLIAALTRLTRDVGIAEDLAQDALVAALEKWPQTGIPDNPGAWLMTTARRRGIDLIRRSQLRERKYEQLAGHMPLYAEDEPELDGGVGDDLLRLIFLTCHPVLAQEARVALALRLLCGLTTEQIARSYLAAEPAIAQRIVRAKRTLAAKQVAFELPEGRELQERLSAVLEALYLMFNEGYAATSGDDLLRPLLCREALRLSRVLAELMPGEPEVHGLARCSSSSRRGSASGWRRTAGSSGCATRTAPAGTGCICGADWRRWSGGARSAGATGRICCRRRSPPAMRRLRPRWRRTGCASRRCTRR